MCCRHALMYAWTSCLDWKYRYCEVKIEVVKASCHRELNPGVLRLRSQCSTTELWQPDNHQFLWWHILTVAAWCATEAFSTNCAAWIVRAGDLSSCRSSVIEHWWFKSGFDSLFSTSKCLLWLDVPDSINWLKISSWRVLINWPPSFPSGALPPPVQAGRWSPLSLLCLLGLTWHHNHQTTSTGHRSGKAQ